MKNNKSLFVIAILVFFVLVWILYAQTSNQGNRWYKLSTNKTTIAINSAWTSSSTIVTNIYEHGVCKTYASTTSTGVFVPTKTLDEWAAFRTNKPSHITLNDCTVSCWSNACPSWKCSISSLETALWKLVNYQYPNSQMCWCHNSWAEVKLFQKYTDPCNRSSQWTYKAVCNGSDSTWRFWTSWWTPITDTSGIWWTAACHYSSSTCTSRCSLPWASTTYIQHSACITAFYSSSVPSWSTCSSQQRQCLNWILGWSYQYQTCSVQWTSYTCSTTDSACAWIFQDYCYNTNNIWAIICWDWNHKATCTSDGWEGWGWCYY